MGGFFLFRFVKKHKFLAIATGVFILFLICMAILIMFSYFAAISYYKSNQQQKDKSAVNVGKASYTYYIPPATSKSGKYNINQDYEAALKALEQVIGQSYTKQWLSGYLGITDTNSPWFNWIYAMYPYALVGYYRGSVLPSISLAQSGIVSELGKSSSSTSANNLYNVSGNPKDWMYSEAGSGGSGGSASITGMPLKYPSGKEKYAADFNWIASKSGIPSWFLAADAQLESNMNPSENMKYGVTTSHALGMLQYLPQTVNILGPNSAWTQYWNGARGYSMQKFINDTCGIAGSKAQIWEKFMQSDVKVQLAVSAYEWIYSFNGAYNYLVKGVSTAGQRYLVGAYNPAITKTIDWNAIFSNGKWGKVFQRAAVFYNCGASCYKLSPFAGNANYYPFNLEAEALSLFGVYPPDADRGHEQTGHSLAENVKYYPSVAGINPSVTGKSVTQTVPTGGGSGDGSTSGLLKYSCQGASLASMSNHQGGVGAVSSATTDSGQLSALASNSLLYGTTPEAIQEIIDKYHLAKLDLLAPQVKTIMTQLESGGSSKNPGGAPPPGVVDKNWAPPKSRVLTGKINTAWKPTNAATLFNYYHLSTAGVPPKLIEMINKGAAKLGCPYVWGAKGERLTSVNQAITIAANHAATGSQKSRTAAYIKDNNIPMNGTIQAFDCSGFFGYAYSSVFGNLAGVTQGSTISQSASSVLEPIGNAKPVPGDVVFYYNNGASKVPGNTDHVGIFLKFTEADGVKCPLILEAPKSGAGVMVGIDTPGKAYKIFKIKAAFN